MRDKSEFADNVPAKDWKVTKLIDNGAGNYYRYTVVGINLNLRPGVDGYDFIWSIPSLCERYDLSDAILEVK